MITSTFPLNTLTPQSTIQETNPFIESNTELVDLTFLKSKCTIPVFTKDNEITISHQEFIEATLEVVKSIFYKEEIEEPEIRVSHQIKGRTPDAIHLPAKDLQEHQKTTYYERMAFLIRIPSINSEIGGNKLSLTIGGVRAYNQENLYNKKTFEKFKLFIGFQNMVCCNLCVSTDGLLTDLKAMSVLDLQDKAIKLLNQYDIQSHLNMMDRLTENTISESQFAQIIGKARMYNFLPKGEKATLPELLLTDGQLNTVVKDYYYDKNFKKEEDNSLSLWKFYNLLTGSNKASYIDTFLERGSNAFAFTEGINNSLNNIFSTHNWFLE